MIGLFISPICFHYDSSVAVIFLQLQDQLRKTSLARAFSYYICLYRVHTFVCIEDQVLILLGCFLFLSSPVYFFYEGGTFV